MPIVALYIIHRYTTDSMQICADFGNFPRAGDSYIRQWSTLCLVLGMEWPYDSRCYASVSYAVISSSKVRCWADVNLIMMIPIATKLSVSVLIKFVSKFHLQKLTVFLGLARISATHQEIVENGNGALWGKFIIGYHTGQTVVLWWL